MSILNWPDHLRAAGVQVVETNNWRNNRPLGDLPDKPYIVWHHDASPAGSSPGALDWIRNAYNAKDASAQIWVSYFGVWYFVGSGVAWHTGAVLSGMPNSYNAVGVETDETTGETWSPALLSSLRRGTAAIAKGEGFNPETWLHFHKTICSPPGRKSDPSDLDLASERKTVRALMSGSVVNPGKPSTDPTDNPNAPGGADPEEDDDMYHTYIPADGPDAGGIWVAAPGIFEVIPSMEYYQALVKSGAAKPVIQVTRREFDILRDSYRRWPSHGDLLGANQKDLITNIWIRKITDRGANELLAQAAARA